MFFNLHTRLYTILLQIYCTIQGLSIVPVPDNCISALREITGLIPPWLLPIFKPI